MERLDHAEITIAMGVPGDFRGMRKPNSRNRRQVTVMAAEAWQLALAELGVDVPWEHRRVNLMVEGLALQHTTGARLVFASGLVLEITGECDPCRRMDDIAPGLEAALRPDWRGGVTTRVAEGGPVEIGDQVRIEP
jgi:MOSC domain-containing protein YiiM